MKSLFQFLIVAVMLLGHLSQGQESQCLKTINSDIWSKFTKSFETMDFNLFASLHREDFVRVSGSSKSVRNKEDYIGGYTKRWTENKLNQTISFRFTERICDYERASERGIYKLTLNPKSEKERSFYGEFHVILTNNNSDWKILVDYDTNPGNSINEESFLAAFAIDDFEKY